MMPPSWGWLVSSAPRTIMARKLMMRKLNHGPQVGRKALAFVVDANRYRVSAMATVIVLDLSRPWRVAGIESAFVIRSTRSHQD